MNDIQILGVIVLVLLALRLFVKTVVQRRQLDEYAESLAAARAKHEIDMHISQASYDALFTIFQRTANDYGELMGKHLTLIEENGQLENLNALLWDRSTLLWQEYEANESLIVNAVNTVTGQRVADIIRAYVAELDVWAEATFADVPEEEIENPMVADA